MTVKLKLCKGREGAEMDQPVRALAAPTENLWLAIPTDSQPSKT